MTVSPTGKAGGQAGGGPGGLTSLLEVLVLEGKAGPVGMVCNVVAGQVNLTVLPAARARVTVSLDRPLGLRIIEAVEQLSCEGASSSDL